jgi:hypothetical protein
MGHFLKSAVNSCQFDSFLDLKQEGGYEPPFQLYNLNINAFSLTFSSPDTFGISIDLDAESWARLCTTLSTLRDFSDSESTFSFVLVLLADEEVRASKIQTL